MEVIRGLSNSGKKQKTKQKTTPQDAPERGRWRTPAMEVSFMYISVPLPPPSRFTPYATTQCFDITINLQNRRQDTPSQKRAFWILKAVLPFSRRPAVLSCECVSFFKTALLPFWFSLKHLFVRPSKSFFFFFPSST